MGTGRCEDSVLHGPTLDCADDLLVVKTHAVRAAYRPPKLPDLGISLAFESLHTTMLHVSSCTAVAEQKNLPTSHVGVGVEKQGSALLCGGSDRKIN